jgi:hypothetical protein
VENYCKHPVGCYSYEFKRGNKSLSFLNSFGFVMSVIYVGLGIFFIVAENVFNFSNVQQIGFGVILISYGFFRFYVALKKKRENELDNDDED